MEAEIENGFAKVGDGEWIAAAGMPAAFKGTVSPLRPRRPGGVSFWRGVLHPDKSRLAFLSLQGTMWCAVKARPFLTRIDLGERVHILTEKLLLAPLASRRDSRLVRVIPFSFRGAFCVTALETGWVLTATASRVTKAVLGEDETLAVKPEAAVAWTGNAPTGFCPRLRARDLFLPRVPKCLALHFHGPSIVWFEGS